MPANFSFSRKPAYQYGWDWGPRIVTAGIWKEAYIILGYQPLINNLRVKPTTPIKEKHPTEINFSINSYISQLQVGLGYTINYLIEKDSKQVLSGQYPFTANSS